MSTSGTSSAAFALSLVSGILILLGAGVGLMWYSVGFPFFQGMMGGFPGMMPWFGFFSPMFLIFAVLGLVSGVTILTGAIMMNSRPEQRRTWGIVVLVFAIVSLLGMGGFIIGAILGIVGGALALS